MKKKTICVAAVLASCITLSATFTGCSLVSQNSVADMAQEIATVDIRKSDKFEESKLKDYKDAIGSTSIVKRSLVSYFLNVGSTYISQYNYSYADTFNLLLDSLIDNAVLTQYATLELLKDKSTNKESLEYDSKALETYMGKESDIAKYEYLLGGEDSDMVKIAKYNLYSSLNSAIDSFEKTKEEDEEYKGTETRTTPTNLNTEQDDYYPKTEKGELDYFIYTGFSNEKHSYLLKDSGVYQDDAKKGTTRATRIEAYNKFLDSLHDNGLIRDDEADKLTDILELSYIDEEYKSRLESCIINKYYDIYEAQQSAELKANSYAYLNRVYNELLKDQTKNYKSASSFETAMGSMSSTSFILYNPKTEDSEFGYGENKQNGKFGFVYNILLPFSSRQSVKLAELNSLKGEDEDDNHYFIERNKLLKNIVTQDQRAAWFNGQTDYSFKASETSYADNYYSAGDANRNYLFFEGNLTQSGEGGRYKKLQAYDGRYSYNGRVYENEDGSYTLVGNPLTIDGMLKEFSAYINFVLKGDSVKFDGGYNPEVGNEAYYNEDNYLEADGKEVNYSKFIYASGNVEFGGNTALFNNNKDLFNANTKQYAAMSAVNELQFAYTTDTGVLSQYVGYSVSAYKTNYIKEFEYAAKLAVSKGAGNFAVCAGDYGWHLVYVTYAFDYGTNGEVYNPDWQNNIDVEGTFENMFFEWVKGNDLSDINTSVRNKILSDFDNEKGDNATVVKYQNRYQNLLDMENNN